MRSMTYLRRRDQLTTYFDQTAASAWRALTSGDPVSRIRATVRAGRDEMRETLLSWLPGDLTGHSVLDAGCGTGALAIEAGQRGADVLGVDIAANLVEVARRRAAREKTPARVEFRVGDMLADDNGPVDHVVAMDSLIHYDADDVLRIVGHFVERARHTVLFTSAPWTPALGLMHFVGRLVPQRQHRAPAIEPIHIEELRRDLDRRLASRGWATGRTHRVTSGFYISQAIELKRTCVV